MVDISKHLARMQQAIERRNWPLALEIGEECMDVAPAEVQLYRLYVDAAKRKAKESDKKSMFGTMGMPAFSKDPLKLLIGAMKKVAASPDAKAMAAAGDAARNVYKSGTKAMIEPAIFLYEEMVATGLFNADVLWNLSHLYFERFQDKKDMPSLESALKTLSKLESAMPNHPEAGRTLKNWDARKSMELRNQKGNASDYRSQMTSTDKAHRAEVMNKNLRTADDAREVLKYADEDLVQEPGKKDLWLKKAETHRRLAELANDASEFANARKALEKAQEIDTFDFNIVIKLGDVIIDEHKAYIKNLEAAGQDTAEAKLALQQIEVDEYKKRCDRQPTEMSHKFNLATRLLQFGKIELAASEFQRTVSDPRYRMKSYKFLGFCFGKKNMVDLALKNYTAYLTGTEDQTSDEAKEVRYLRGRQHEQAGHKAEAISDFSSLVEMDLAYKDCAARLEKLQGA
jgi:tetratricopeptide (TPR) repeat protein